MSQNSVSDSRDHHVHFDSSVVKEEFGTESCVTYKRSGDTIIVNLGFLQFQHKYSIDLKLPAALFTDIESVSFVPDVTTVPNLNCRITEFSGLDKEKNDVYEMKIEFFAYKEHLLREVLHIVNKNNHKEVFKLVTTARVLGKGKGTPMLRNGIHCIGSPENED